MPHKKKSSPTTDLHRLLDAQRFQTIEELEAFMNSLMGKPIPHFPEDSKTNRHKAQDLVNEAYELPPQKGKIKVQQALTLYPECIEAYLYLAEAENLPGKAKKHLEKGISIGRRIYGGDFLNLHKGHFWAKPETRPFLLCLEHYGMFLYGASQPLGAIRIFEELIELNTGDNQGIRDTLLLILLEYNKDNKFRKYSKMFKGDSLAIPLYTRALFAFKNEGASPRAELWLKKAMHRNQFIPAKLLASAPPHQLPDVYSPGDEREASLFAYTAHHIWRKIPGAMDWLRSHLHQKE